MSTVRYVPHPRETRDVSRGFAALPSLAFQWGPAGSRIGRASAGARATRRGEGGGGGPPARRRRAQVKSMKPQLLVVHVNAAFSHKPYVHQCMACAHALNNCWSYSKKKLLSENMTDTRHVHGMDCGPTY